MMTGIGMRAGPSSTTVVAEPGSGRIWTVCTTDSLFRDLNDATLLRRPASATMWRFPVARGGIRVVIEHEEIDSVTPEMLEWWFTHFPYIDILLPDRQVVSAYRLWHPFDHRRVSVKQHSLSGQLGMAVGARVELESSWGKFARNSTLRVRRMDAGGYLAQVVAGPWIIAAIKETFERTNKGTRCVTSLTLQSRFSAYLLASRTRRFTQSVVDAWVKHKIEEIGNLQRILPQLYYSFLRSENDLVSMREATDSLNSDRLGGVS